MHFWESYLTQSGFNGFEQQVCGTKGISQTDAAVRLFNQRYQSAGQVSEVAKANTPAQNLSGPC